MNLTRPLNCLLLVPLLFALIATIRAETPADQVKAAAGIPLTTALLDKMDAALKDLNSDAAAKAELGKIDKDPNMTSESWAAAINSKCPKAAAHFKSAGITAEDFAKGISAIMICGMNEDLANSDDKTAKANAEFVKANNDRANKTFADFMTLSMSSEPSSSPAPTP